jgi:hypothetical protein
MEFKAALDKALMEQMQKLSIKQKKAEKEQVANICIPVITFVYQTQHLYFSYNKTS